MSQYPVGHISFRIHADATTLMWDVSGTWSIQQTVTQGTPSYVGADALRFIGNHVNVTIDSVFIVGTP